MDEISAFNISNTERENKVSDIFRNCEKQFDNMSNNSNCENPLVKYFFLLPPKQLALLSTLVGILLIDNLDVNQQNSLGNFIVNVGQAILVSAAQSQVLQNNTSQKDFIRHQIQILKKKPWDRRHSGTESWQNMLNSFAVCSILQKMT